MQATAARLIREGRTGCIINIASNSGFVPKLEQADYGASKAALVSLTRSAALSLGPNGIRVNAIAPGIIDTPLTQSIAVQRGEVRGVAPEETLRPVIANLPLGRMGQPEEIAQMAVFLASARAAYITGQTILVDGGQWMR
jgi:D-sorbitol dehydrogenase (acceptor)